MKIDEQFLQEMGLEEMPEGQKQDFLVYMQRKLEATIGKRIAYGVPKKELAGFDAVSDGAGARAWLKRNRPDYREVAAQAFEELKTEIRANRAQLLGRA